MVFGHSMGFSRLIGYTTIMDRKRYPAEASKVQLDQQIKQKRLYQSDNILAIPVFAHQLRKRIGYG